MRYVGGKTLIAGWVRDHIMAVADQYRGMSLTYVEPFVGSGAVLVRVAPRFVGKIVANDIHPDLIRMWHAVTYEGWEPPGWMGETEYKELRNSGVSTPLRGFAGFCFSFGGKWMSGFERRASAQRSERTSVLRRASIFRRRNVEWKNTDFADLVIPPQSIVYCDPPYINTGEDCYAERFFNHVRFWSVMDSWVAQGAIVFVSEYSGPPHWPVIDEYTRPSVLGASTGQLGDMRVEKLYMRRL